jgi:hypothetical protein
MQEPSVKMFRVTVLFNPTNLSNPVTLVCDDFLVDQSLNGRQLSIPQGISLIVLDLLQLPGGDPSVPAAVFGINGTNAEGTIQWFDPDNLSIEIPTPTVFLVQSFFPSHCTIIDVNTDKNQNPHPFTVNVFYGGRSYPQDPTIVNEPPMPVG